MRPLRQHIGRILDLGLYHAGRAQRTVGKGLMYRITETDASWCIERVGPDGRWHVIAVRPSVILAAHVVNEMTKTRYTVRELHQ